MKRFLLGALAVLVVGGAVFLVPTLWFKPWSIDHFYGRVFIRYALRHPMMLTQLGMLDGTPLDFHSDKLDDFSVAFQEADAKFGREQLAILKSYDRSHMSPSQKLSAQVLEWFLTDAVNGERFMYSDYPVNQLFGAQSSLPDFMITTHPLKRPKDAENYVKRVERFGVAIDQVIGQLTVREKKGVIPPRFVLTKVLTEMRGFAGKPAKENVLYTHFAEKAPEIKKLDAAKRDALLARLDQAITGTVQPAYQRLIDTCAHLESVTTDDDGVWKLPEGDAFYAYCLRNRTTTDLPADSIHALGLREVDRIQSQMRGILAAKGYRGADLATTVNAVRAEPRFHYPEGDSGRAQILADYQTIIDDANGRVGALFNVRPKSGVKVERVPPFKEATAPGGYYNAPDMGGDRPGKFFANLRDPRETTKPGMRTLAYHEAIPGHHFQISIAQELKDVPFFRKVIPFTAYVEGWGLYAERLALEEGFHPTAFDSLGALQAELFRAVRLVVDTGIHHDHWTRQQAIDYMKQNTGMAETAVVTEVERYIVAPGQACAYKVGQLEILALRQRAKDKLGDRFDIKKFHDVVLTNGALPLGLLEQVVNEWIATEQASAKAQVRG
ncbi:MAG TPA: DUF885 domain-containing protein [Candidatus Eisenbacteria bacterium]|nr:DUF885 domain-containing protein [Candidatus Eisenbacteria bacterium]